MTELVHPSAIIAPSAKLEPDVHVGPYCVVGPDVVLGSGSRLVAHVTVFGPTRIGARNTVYPYAVLGMAPQDRGYRDEPTELVIGSDNVIREHVTVHRGTIKGGGITRIGSGTLLMVGAHVAHDVCIGDNAMLTNGVLLGGHVRIDPWVVAAGQVAVAPFVHVGESAFLAGGAMVERDVPPYVIAAGDRARVRTLNRVGLQRRQVPEASRSALKIAFRLLYRSEQPRTTALAEVERSLGQDPYVARLVSFLKESLSAV